MIIRLLPSPNVCHSSILCFVTRSHCVVERERLRRPTGATCAQKSTQLQKIDWLRSTLILKMQMTIYVYPAIEHDHVRKYLWQIYIVICIYIISPASRHALETLLVLLTLLWEVIDYILSHFPNQLVVIDGYSTLVVANAIQMYSNIPLVSAIKNQKLK